jgi:hypothetical protein
MQIRNVIAEKQNEANITGNEAADEKGVDIARGGKDSADNEEGSVEQQR